MFSLVGLGGAGSQIVELFYRKEKGIFKIIKEEDYVKGVAIDTADDIVSLSSIPLENRVLIGKSSAKGHGAGGDVELGRKILLEESEIAMSAVRKANAKKPELFFLLAGVGGGTGTGGFPVLAEKLKNTYGVPVIGVLVLPSRSEGTLYVKNTRENLEKLFAACDGCLLADNNVLAARGEELRRIYKLINEAIFDFLGVVEPGDVLSAVKGTFGAIGYMRIKAEKTSSKDILEKMFRDYVYINPERKAEKLHLVILGDKSAIYGQDAAKRWAEEKLGAEVQHVFKQDASSKHLNIGLIVTGIKGLREEFELKSGAHEKKKSELEELLSEIRSL